MASRVATGLMITALVATPVFVAVALQIPSGARFASPAIAKATSSISEAVGRASFLKLTAASVVATVFGFAAAEPASALNNGKSKSGYDLTPMTPEEVKQATASFSDIQKKVLLEAGTERSGTGSTTNGYGPYTKEEGVWVSAASGIPLFSSSTKYESGTGWPSFYAPVDMDHIIVRVDPRDAATMPQFLQRMEVIDRKSGTHLGHVFDDGPKPTGKRYCMNASAMAFIPKGEPLPVQPKK